MQTSESVIGGTFMFNFKSYLKRIVRNEFKANLKNHPLGNQNIYRLHYILYYRTQDDTDAFRTIDYPFEPFELPNGMSREDAFKVLSYLTNDIERKKNLEPCSYQSVSSLNEILNLQRLGFKKIGKNCDEKDIIDLFTISGRVLLFKESHYYSSYFEWYSENVTLTEVKNIYKKINIEFYDLIPIN